MNFILGLFISLIQCGVILTASKYDSIVQPRIIGGHEAKPYSHPYLVSLQLRFLWMRAHICGGSIVNKNWVITAAHCIQDSWLTRWLPLEAIAGAHDVYTFGIKVQTNPVIRRIPHPNYKGGIGPYDVAMLRTMAPFYFSNEVQPVRLPPNNNFINGETMQLAGWGALRTTSFIPDLPSRLQEVQVKYIPYDECYKALEEILEGESNPLDKNAHICTGPLSGGIAACSGDSGGPLIQIVSDSQPNGDTVDIAYDDNFVDSDFKLNKDNNNDELDTNSPVLIGIVSWGMAPCGIEGAPTVYTNVSEYMHFIKKHIDT